MLWNRFEELAGGVRDGVRRRFHTLVDAAGLDEDAGPRLGRVPDGLQRDRRHGRHRVRRDRQGGPGLTPNSLSCASGPVESRLRTR